MQTHYSTHTHTDILDFLYHSLILNQKSHLPQMPSAILFRFRGRLSLPHSAFLLFIFLSSANLCQNFGKIITRCLSHQQLKMSAFFTEFYSCCIFCHVVRDVCVSFIVGDCACAMTLVPGALARSLSVRLSVTCKFQIKKNKGSSIFQAACCCFFPLQRNFGY